MMAHPTIPFMVKCLACDGWFPRSHLSECAEYDRLEKMTDSEMEEYMRKKREASD